MSTKEQIAAALKKSFRRKEVKIADSGVTVSVRELSRDEREALDKRLFKVDSAGKFIEENGYLVAADGSRLVEEWLAATLDPSFTVEELLSNDWPASVKAMLYREARAVNTVSLEDAAKNS